MKEDEEKEIKKIYSRQESLFTAQQEGALVVFLTNRASDKCHLSLVPAVLHELWLGGDNQIQERAPAYTIRDDTLAAY